MHALGVRDQARGVQVEAGGVGRAADGVDDRVEDVGGGLFDGWWLVVGIGVVGVVVCWC